MCKGQELKEKREKLGISRTEIEQDISGITYQDVINVEKWGNIHPSASRKKKEFEEKYKKIEKYLNNREKLRGTK